MGLCEGKEIEFQDISPPELQKLRRVIAQYITPKVGEPATAMPEGMPLYAEMDPLTLMARDIMFGMGGYQQQPVSPYGTYQWGDYVRPQPSPVGPVTPTITPTPSVDPGVSPQPAGPGQTPQPTPGAESGPTVAAVAQPGPAAPTSTPLPEPPIIPGPEPVPTPNIYPEPSPYPEPSVEPKVQPIPYVEPAPGPEPGPVGPSLMPGPAGPVGPPVTGPQVGPVAIPGLQPTPGSVGPALPFEPVVSPTAEIVLVGPQATVLVGPVGQAGQVGPVGTAGPNVTALTVVPGAIIRPQPGAIDMAMVGIRPQRQY